MNSASVIAVYEEEIDEDYLVNQPILQVFSNDSDSSDKVTKR